MKLPDKLELRNVGELVPYERNSRTHSKEQVAQIAASIAEFGWTNPIIIDAAGDIIAGHGRLEAAKLLGMQKVPCVVIDHLTDAQRKALVIADNKLALNANWDFKILTDELMELDHLNYDMQLTGFSEKELDLLLGGNENERKRVGVKEYTREAFSEFDHECPKCGFSFNDKEKKK